MESEEIYTFLNIAADKVENCWDLKTLSEISNQRVPDAIMCGRGSLLRADVHTLWTQWFVEAICDPDRFADKGYAYIVDAVQKQMPVIFPNTSKTERNKLTSYIARLIDKELQRRKNRQRFPLDKEERKMLWDLHSPSPRCWICGYKFTTWAENKFLGYDTSLLPPSPAFIDYITLHGLTSRDLSVEIDHVVPFSKGGAEGENLRLSCGWCNSHKGNRISLYDVSTQHRVVIHPKSGKQSLPHPFWIVRLFALRKSCEHESGCDRSVTNEQLTVIPKHPNGVMNPTNLRLTCLNHDPLGSERFMSRTAIDKMREPSKNR